MPHTEHNVRRLERLRRVGSLDEATSAAVDALVQDFAADAGGLENVSNRELALLEDAAMCRLIVHTAVGYAMKQGSLFTADGRLLPVLERSLLAYVNTTRLNLVAVGLRRSREKAIDDLDEHASALAASERTS